MYSLSKLFQQKFEGHKGRPGKRGGSLPKSGGSSADSTGLKGEKISSEMFEDRKNNKLPPGWGGTKDSIHKRVSTGLGDYKVIVEYHNGSYAHLVAIGDMSSENFSVNSPTLDKGRVKWEDLQGEIDSLASELAKL
jgi:hypothetical protein